MGCDGAADQGMVRNLGSSAQGYFFLKKSIFRNAQAERGSFYISMILRFRGNFARGTNGLDPIHVSSWGLYREDSGAFMRAAGGLCLSGRGIM